MCGGERERDGELHYMVMMERSVYIRIFNMPAIDPHL